MILRMQTDWWQLLTQRNQSWSGHVWVFWGEDEESEGTYLVYDEANDMKFAFTFEDETETEMTIGVEGGTLTLERQETDLLASFFETMLTGGFAQTEDGAE